MASTKNRDLMITKDGGFSIGVYDSPKDGEFVLGLWEIFLSLVTLCYLRCDVITGFFTGLMMATQISLVKFLIEADQGENAIFGGNMWTITLYLYILGWTTQFVGHGIFERKYHL
jgi:uncharacterized membrane protein YGL010W